LSKIEVKKNVRSRNEQYARENRRLFHQSSLLAVNILGSPGSGKTSLIEQLTQHIQPALKILVIEGDVETDRDADRIRALGIEAIQIQTHGACHLDALMIAKSIRETNLDSVDLLLIENVGNLICPAGFDLGEDLRVIVGNTAEGDDKPVKYPEMYFKADACVINKIDLLDHVNFNMEEFEAGARRTNQDLRFFRISCTTGEGVGEWASWLTEAFASNK